MADQIKEKAGGATAHPQSNNGSDAAVDYDALYPTHMLPNHYIILRLPSENFRVVKLVPGSKINLGKFGTFAVDDILGHPFGFTYEIEALPNQTEDQVSKLTMIDSRYQLDESEEIAELDPQENNRELLYSSDVQALTGDEIELLKKQGLSGQEIIEKVKASHSSFDKKTAFSQEKYIKRKQQKFLQQFTPEPIGSSELIDIYIGKDPARIMEMSAESLGLILSLANVKPGGNYLVVDDVSGLLVAAIMERLGGEGTIVVAHENEHANLDALKYMNYSPEMVTRMVKTISWLEYLHPEESEEFEYKSHEELYQYKSTQRGQYHRKRIRAEGHKVARQLIDGAKFDGVVLATELHLPELVPLLVPAVRGSGSIAVYSEYKEQLIDLTHVLLSDLRVLAPTIMETRVRKYQTLPGRMHPHMTSRGGGGYVLWGTRVFPAQVNALGVGRKRKAERA